MSYEQDQLDYQYNTTNWVPDEQDHIKLWVDESAKNIPTYMDISYGSSEDEVLDIFSKPGVRNQSVLIFIHGGFWRCMDKKYSAFIVKELIKDGVVVIIPKYSLCPKVTIEQIAAQLRKACSWVYKNIDCYNGNPNSIVVSGHSAGGQLCGLMASTNWSEYDNNLPTNLFKSAIGISGLYDLLPISQTPFLKKDLRLEEESAKEMSPINNQPTVPEFYALVGSKQSHDFRRQSSLIQEYWGETVKDVVELEDLNHFSIM